jgi:polyketide synthase PksM
MGVGNGDGEETSVDESLMEAGMDSLASVAFTQRLSTVWELPAFSPTLIFDYPTIREISAHIKDRLGEDCVEA